MKKLIIAIITIVFIIIIFLPREKIVPFTYGMNETEKEDFFEYQEKMTEFVDSIKNARDSSKTKKDINPPVPHRIGKE